MRSLPSPSNIRIRGLPFSASIYSFEDNGRRGSRSYIANSSTLGIMSNSTGIDNEMEILKFVSDNIGKQFSATSIVKFLKSQNTETSAKMILTYLEYLSNAFIIDRVNRYDIHGKRLFELGDKFYFEDLGIRNHIIGGDRC